MILRTYCEADREAVIALWHAVGLTRPWNDPGRDIDRATSTWPERRGNEAAHGFYGGLGHSEDEVTTFGKRLIVD
jgi:hypothetical protein